MKGVLLAGGTGSRLYPLTKIMNKSLLPLGRKTIIEHVLSTLTSAGISDIMLISGSSHFGQLAQLLGSGSDHNCQITYRVQDNANGIAAALALCEDFVGKNKFATILGDNIFEDPQQIGSKISKFEESSENEFTLFAKSIEDPERFGVAVYDNGKLVDIVEKPQIPPSNDAITGLYLYSPFVFDIIRKLSISARGEYEISDVNSYLVKHHKGNIEHVECQWIDTGTHKSYERATEIINKKIK
jgi:glucose-1-phosphate thymidylyltransferase